MPLDSDDANADSKLYVEFYEFDREPYRGQPFIRIMVPGDKTNVIDRPVRDHDKARFARLWLAYQMRNAQDPGIGRPLAEWRKECPDDLSQLQLEELLILKFQTVEQLADASDIQLQRIGMGGPGLREKARIHLKRRNGDLSKTRDEELDNTRAKLAELQEQMAELLKRPVAVAAPIRRRGPNKVKSKPGRPRKVNVQHNDAATGAAGNQ